MRIAIYKETKSFIAVSNITKEEYELLKKYNPAALKLFDKDGNEEFAIGYNEGKPGSAAFGVTFSGVSTDGHLMIVGNIPANVKPEKQGEYVADYIGAALPKLNVLEVSVPEAAAAVTGARATLIGGIQVI